MNRGTAIAIVGLALLPIPLGCIAFGGHGNGLIVAGKYMAAAGFFIIAVWVLNKARRVGREQQAVTEGERAYRQNLQLSKPSGGKSATLIDP